MITLQQDDNNLVQYCVKYALVLFKATSNDKYQCYNNES